MIPAVERASQSYQMSALWYALDSMPREQTGDRPFSAYSSQLPEDFSGSQAPFDRFAEMTAYGLAKIISAAIKIKETTDLLLSESSAFQLRTTDTDRPELASAAAKAGARFGDYAVRTDQLACAQQNSGFAFMHAERFPLAGGFGEFELRRADESKLIAVAFDAADTNAQALNKISRAVNRMDAGVTARLIPGGDPGTVKLQVTADDTGYAHAFSLSDMQGHVIAVTGIGRLSVSSQNAVYSVNGGSVVSSPVNRIVLDEDRVTVTLKKASPGPVHLSVRPDIEAVQADIARLVGQFNALRRALEEANGWLSPYIRTKLLGSLPFETLPAAGIHPQADGMLLLDESELARRLSGQFEEVKRSLTGEEGFVCALGRAAERLQSMPADALLNRWYSGFRAMTRYSAAGRYGYNYGPGNPACRSYWPMPIAGYVLNDYL